MGITFRSGVERLLKRSQNYKYAWGGQLMRASGPRILPYFLELCHYCISLFPASVILTLTIHFTSEEVEQKVGIVRSERQDKLYLELDRCGIE
jgi:hypothetical protein